MRYVADDRTTGHERLDIAGVREFREQDELRPAGSLSRDELMDPPEILGRRQRADVELNEAGGNHANAPVMRRPAAKSQPRPGRR